MAKSLAILLLTLTMATAAADPPPAGGIGRESGDELLARCEPALAILEGGGAGLSAEQREAGTSCIAFVDGFVWGHAWSAWRERTDMFYCPPDGFGARDGVPIVVQYLRDKEHRRIQRAHLLVFAAFNRAFPCMPVPLPP